MPHDIEQQILLACQLEATARKPGNVHPAASFDDLCYDDLIRSAAVVAPLLAQTQQMGVGQTIPADAKIIQLDMDATLIGQNRETDVPLVGNLACDHLTLPPRLSPDRAEVRNAIDVLRAAERPRLRARLSPSQRGKRRREVMGREPIVSLVTRGA